MPQRSDIPRVLMSALRIVCIGTMTTVALIMLVFGVAGHWKRFQFYYSPRDQYHWRVYSAWGHVGFHRMDKGPGTGLDLSISRLKEYTRPPSLIHVQWWFGSYGKTTVSAPWWLVTPICAAYPVAAIGRGPFLRRWRRKRGLCLNCGYDLTGNVSGRCPECGRGV